MSKPTILLTRAETLNTADQEFFEQMGYQTQIIPLAEIVQLPLSQRAVKNLRNAEWLFFTSQAPVLSVLKQANKASKVAVIGKKTAAIVRNSGFSVDFISPIETKAAMVSAWKEHYPESTTIFYAKSQLADTYVAQQLVGNYTVYAQTTYENRLPEVAASRLQKMQQVKAIQAVYLTSPSAWRRFRSIYQGEIKELQLIAIGPTTQQAIQQDGFQAIRKDQMKLG
ncbi:hypothetical protein BAU15_01075 [Enterococcus sp. JM4C]|uniref:uroporphyrinogen-III synthase n=1 Tax=Candidatus Enterococcus huntleyi TaxID=1857217 RepID=UPI00137B41B3|nr:uroporphyrinogen-III synthase [Enterococcus sp. JM4C]KAF1299268.1 hypothetical protein BAU15_01075 [Enterococcus sp. JM4C]